MIKPILYHDFEEKERLEKKLMAVIPKEKRLSTSEALMKIFHKPRTNKISTSKSKSK